MSGKTILTVLFLAAASTSILLDEGPAQAAEPFRRGDSSDDGVVDLSDVENLLGYLFQASPTPPCFAASDVNGDGLVELTDAVFLLLYLFLDGTAPPAPGAINCGVAPPGSLDCESYTHCGGAPQISTAPKALPAELLAGERVSLSVAATDPDSEMLSYSWTQIDPATPQGTFIAGRTLPAAAWRPPAVGAQTVFTLQVKVSDPAGHSVTGSVTVLANIPAYGANVQPIWTSTCSCHSGTFPSAGLPLSTGRSHAALVNVAAGTCRPQVRVLPFQPDSSQLIKRLTGIACGSRMPSGNAGFFDANPNQLIRIRSWILAGALNN